jgi:hypothetical protein
MRWEGSVKVDGREIGCDDGSWTELVQDRTVYSINCV